MTMIAEKLQTDNGETRGELRGRLTENAKLGAMGWFKTGGNAECLYKPADLDDLITFLKSSDRLASGADLHVFGVMSNSIIRDGGVSGVVIRLGREFASMRALDNERVEVGAMALDANAAKFAADNGIAGLEFFSGIPGTIGGALRMNAGCYGTETKDVLIEAEAVDRAGNVHILKPEDMGMTYRHTTTPKDYIFTRAVFQGRADKPDAIKDRMSEIRARREDSQPIREKTGGSTFANPSADDINNAGLPWDTKVWQLIDKVGGRGFMVGGAQMSEKHCNFMINTGTATAADLENLGEEIRRRVQDSFGIQLRWEVRRIGELLV